MGQVTTELCDAKHSEVINDLSEIKAMLKDLYDIVKGNGKPGLRQTQAEVVRLRQDFDRQCEEINEAMKEEKKQRESRLMFFLRPLLPIIYGMIFGGLYIGFS